MLKKMPLVLSADDLLERAFRKAKKKQITDRNALYKKKKTIIARTESFATTVISTLEKYVKEFPSIDSLPLFYQELIDIKIDVNKLRKSLGAVDWARKTCNMIYSKQARSLKKSGKLDFLKQKQNEIYGRISSVVKQIDNELKLLANAQNIIKKFPEVCDIPTIVIAGYPNVGKSSLLKCLSKARPEIAQYPFTTKEIHVGHIEKEEKYILKRFQVIDTPGLLDRPLSEKNEIEKQAIAALTHLADMILFVMDSSETCGYPLEDQKRLLSQMEKMFSTSSIVLVENKVDFKRTDSSNLKISCETGEGIDILLEKIFSYFKSEDNDQ
ncbi:MAG: 50S ribosome-binding GTPase [Thermoplasmatales archaeon]|nr:50S ribosome-binding GTPase [Thermoplasmatales archaeon]